nr:S9 family peptidase [Alteromonas profundi]
MIKINLIGAALATMVVAGCATTPTTDVASTETSAPAVTPLTLDRIYKQREFQSERSTYFTWLKDGSGYTVLEKRSSDTDASNDAVNNSDVDALKDDIGEAEASVSGYDIVFYKPDSTGRKVLVNFEKLIPEGQDEPISIERYSWSKDGKWLLIFTNGQKVWRSNSRGDFYTLNLDTNELLQLGGEEPGDARLMFAKFSPDSQHIAWVRDNNIYMQPVGTNNVEQLTHDGSDIIVNGTFDWVYEEEFSIRDGFRWSPDSKSIAYWQLDTSGVKTFTMINNTDSLYPTLTTFPYPKAGEQNSAVKVGVVDVTNGETHWADLAGDNRDRYIPRISWAGEGDTLLIQDVNRPQNTNKLWTFDWKNNQLTNIYTDKDEAFLEWFYDAKFINGGNDFIWHSERDGWRHLYRIAKDGSQIVDLTPGEYDIVDLLAVNEDNNALYFTASPEDVSQRYLYKATLDGSEEVVRVTPEKFAGTNSYYMSEDGSYARHSFSNFTTPPMREVIKVDGHEPIKSLITNTELKQKLANENLPSHEFFQVQAQDGVTLDGYIMFPPNMDPSKKYPIIFYVYGEPWGQTVKDSWRGGSYLWDAMMTQKGYIVASVDNRGTRAPKGRDWRKSIYKKLGVITVRDQADALAAMAERWSVIDTDRVGVWGHSGGGTQTLNLLFRYADKYKVGVAVAPVPDLSLYDTIYQERYSGNPKTDPQSYENSSALYYADGLEGDLLLIHGTGDDNVHYQGSERLINELIKHNKQFDFMSYPNRSHGIYEGKNTTLHLKTLISDYFIEHL